MKQSLFSTSHLKVKRANKYIRELHGVLSAFGKKGSYRMFSKPDPETGFWTPWSVTVLEPGFDGDGEPIITGVHNHLQPFMPSLVESFGLPELLTDADPVIQAAPVFD